MEEPFRGPLVANLLSAWPPEESAASVFGQVLWKLVTASGQVLWRVATASGQVLWRVATASGQVLWR